MSDGSVLTAGLDQAAGALKVFALEAQIAAFNIANISTGSFKPARLELATAYGDRGVRVDAIRRDGCESCSALNLEASSSSEEVSGTDLAKEFAHLIEAKNSFIANAKVIGVIDGLNETLLNIKT